MQNGKETIESCIILAQTTSSNVWSQNVCVLQSLEIISGALTISGALQGRIMTQTE